MPAAVQANEKIEAITRTDPRLGFVDVYSRMLDDRGQPRLSLFLPDRLHLNAAGYDAWLSELVPALERVHDLPPSSRAIRLPQLGGVE